MVRRFVIPKSERSAALRYIVAVLSVIIATGVRFPVQPVLGSAVPFLLYFPAVLFSAWYGGFGPGLSATLLGATASNFFWMEPEFAFAPMTVQNTIQLGLFVLVSLFMSWLVDLLHGSVISLKSAEREIAGHAQRFQVTLSSIGDGVIATDREACIQFMNPVAEAMTGWKFAEVAGKPLPAVFRIVAQETREAIPDPVQTVLSEKRVVQLRNHTMLVARDGTERVIEDSAAPIRDDGEVLGVVLVFHDVTERDETRRVLAATDRRLAEVLSSMNDGFFVFDRDWRVVFVNESGARLAQKAREELLGKNLWELFSDEVGQPAHKELTRAMKEQSPAHFEYLYSRYGRWYEFKAYPTQEGLALYASDITEKKNVQQAIQSELENRVAQKTSELEGKNQSLEALTYSLAHDLRAPMRAIHGFASILLDEYGKSIDPEGQQIGTRIINAARHAEKLMTDLLEYGKLAHVALPISVVDTEAVIDTLLRRSAQEIVDAGAKVDLIRPLPKLQANETVLAQTLHNLLSNALKYTRDGRPASVRIFAEDKGETSRLVVQDQGSGIHADDIPKLFKPFTRLSGKKPGSGLGLSIVAKGVERMRGRVGVESGPEEGSRFWIELRKA